MKFYDCKTAPSPRRVRIFIAEKGMDIETVQVDLGGGEQFGEAFRKINADCVVPALELDDGTCISEVLAICSYLEELHPEPNLMGTNAAERASVLMWNTKIEQQGFMAIADAVRNVAERLKNRAVTGPEPYAQIPELAERGRKRATQFFQRLDGQLANSTFVAGDSYSIADISALVVTDFATRVKISLPDDAENLQRWYESVAGRPSAAV
ncbi:MAG: glutathione S-transferase family protein [Proteobacteria bacterium]|nr:glutathione S-transferase family protein [Pseudomonadota bacterium]